MRVLIVHKGLDAVVIGISHKRVAGGEAGNNTTEAMMVDTHYGKEGHHCGKVDVSETVRDSAKLEHVSSGRLVGAHVNDSEGVNVVKSILGTHGVEMLDRRGEHLHTAIDVIQTAEKLMELGSVKTVSDHHVGVEALTVDLLTWLCGDPVGDRVKPRVGLVRDNFC